MAVVSLNAAAGLLDLRAGDPVELSGPVLSLRDASAARLAAAIARGEPLPVSLAGRVMYAVGPSPAPPGKIIGKGELHGEEMAPFTQHGAVYLAAIGGMGALLAKHITTASVVAYQALGPEALYALELERFPQWSSSTMRDAIFTRKPAPDGGGRADCTAL